MVPKLTPNQIKKLAEDAFEAACISQGHACYFTRLKDTSDIRARMKVRGQKSYASLGKNPADYVVTLKCEMFYAEVKGLQGERFSFDRFEPSQIAGMVQQQAAGGEYYVFIFDITNRAWYTVPGCFILANRSTINSITLEKLRKDYYCGTNPLSNVY